MKTLGKIFQMAGVVMALAMFVATSQAAQTITGQAEVKAVHGDVTFAEPGSKVLPLVPGIILSKPGTVITTAKDASVELWLGANGEQLILRGDSTLQIDKLELSSDGSSATTELDLKKGSVKGNVKKISAASTFNVKYAKGVAAIRGTTWGIFPDGTVACSEGSVTVTFVINGVPTTVTINAGQQVTPGNPPVVGPATNEQLTVLNGGGGGGNIQVTIGSEATTTVHISATTGVNGETITQVIN